MKEHAAEAHEDARHLYGRDALSLADDPRLLPVKRMFGSVGEWGGRLGRWQNRIGRDWPERKDDRPVGPVGGVE